MVKNNTILVVYTQQTSPRLEYIVSILFDDLLGLPFSLKTFSLEESASILQSNNPHLFYIAKNELSKIDNTFNKPINALLKNSSNRHILFETGIDNFFYSKALKENIDGLQSAFSNSLENAILSFDIFSAMFYLISRYEEYDNTAKRDHHGRYLAENSLAFQGDFLQIPIVEIWAKALQKALQKVYPNLVFNPPKYRFQPTFDIDMAWCYKHKNWQQTLGGSLKDMIKGNFRGLKRRYKGIFGSNTDDPFYSFNFIENLHQESPALPLIFFFLLGKYSEFDKNTSPKNPFFKTLIADLSKKYRVGIHPSYRSNLREDILQNEIAILADICKKKIGISRQHFLKMDLPTTYRRLIAQGIMEDWSMGYAEHLGFRAGISQPFYWFDLLENKATALRIVPFCMMDVTLRRYLGLSPDEAIKQANRLIETIKNADAQLVTLWHNSSLSEQDEWQNWRAVYENIVSNAECI